MTGYTVHTGTTVKFAGGWDRIFGGKKTAKAVAKSTKKAAKKGSVKSTKAAGKKASKKSRKTK